MENRGLLFIPDISGFTRFVHATEIDHSRMIIQELLEVLIDTNQLGLQISEIEGDAILFYKYGESPKLEDLYSQVEKMFCEFNRHILAYDISRYCFCKACNSAAGLRLKIITHYGEFTSYKVRDFNKLIGKDVIVAHQLLKNEIENHEYWLLTTGLLEAPPQGPADWMNWSTNVKRTDNGEINYFYTELRPLRENISPEPYPVLELSKKTRVLSVSRDYDTDWITLFHAAGDFAFRHRWMEGVQKVEEVTHYLPRVGMRCRYIMENGESVIYSSSYSYDDKKIEYSETDEKKEKVFHYIIEKTGSTTARLTIDLYIKKNVLAETLFRLKYRDNLYEQYQKSLTRLEHLVIELDYHYPDDSYNCS